MASIRGNEVHNNRGSSAEFSNFRDAWQAYKLLCDFEAYQSELVRRGVITVNDPSPVKTETRHFDLPVDGNFRDDSEQNPDDGYGGFGRTAQND